MKIQKSENIGVAPLKVNGIIKTKPTEQAEALNNQFHSAFTTPKPLKLSNICELNKLKTETHQHEMEIITITTEGTAKLLQNLNATKAIGPDNIPPYFLKVVSSEIAPIITDLINCSINTGQVSND